MTGDGIANIFTEDTDLNIIKSWLCGSTDGQTYSINDRFLPRITCKEFGYNFECIEEEWDNRIGYKHDWKVDDPKLEEEAVKVLNLLNDLIADINANPRKWFCADDDEDSEIRRMEKDLGTSKDYIIACFYDMAATSTGPISVDYISGIAENCYEDILRDLWECADHEDWCNDDLRLALGRALTNKLGIGTACEL